MAQITVNSKKIDVKASPDTPLLWVIRDHLGLTGTKYGCGQGLCGACTVIIDGEAKKSCTIELEDVDSKQAIETIESLEVNGKLSDVQQAWFDQDVPQCGYCQSGLIMAVTALLRANPKPSDDDIRVAIKNICRCGTYVQVKAAIAQCVTI